MVDSMRLYGQAMLEYLGGGPGIITIERDHGHKESSDVKSLFAPYREWREDERAAIKSA